MAKIKFSEVQGKKASDILKSVEVEREAKAPMRWENGKYKLGSLAEDANGDAIIPVTKLDDNGNVVWSKAVNPLYLFPFTLNTKNISDGVMENSLNGIASTSSKMLEAIEDGKTFSVTATKTGYTVNGAAVDNGDLIIGNKTYKSQTGTVINIITQ